MGPDGAVVGELDYVGYWFAREHWGRGIATRALAALLEGDGGPAPRARGRLQRRLGERP